MTVRSRFLAAAALGFCMAHPLFGQEPARLAVPPGQSLPGPVRLSVNQQVANTIAEQLRQSGQLRKYTIDVVYRDGTADLRGTVADQPQREEALRLAQGVPGVDRVLDHLAVTGGESVTRVQAQTAPVAPPDAAPLPNKAPETGPPPTRVPEGIVGQPAEPLPLYQGPIGGGSGQPDPKMPPYAWPTYAPYNNYSRVAYPEAYPYNAWPFIGPVYPFPKIPLGWRAVKLEWQDGSWWFSQTATKHDWWRLRYW